MHHTEIINPKVVCVTSCYDVHALSLYCRLQWMTYIIQQIFMQTPETCHHTALYIKKMGL
jgi:hypothetical protein